MPVPTRRLAILAVLVAVAMLFGPDSWPGVADTLPVGPWDLPGPVVAANVVLLGLAAIDGLLAGKAGSVEIDREMPRAIALNVRGDVTWNLRNPGPVRRTVAFGDEFAPSLRAGVRRARVTLPARGSATVATEIMPARRGDFAIENLVVRVEGPLGLGARQHRRSLPALLRVLPPFRSRDDAELRIGQSRILEVGLRSSRGLGTGTEFDQLREYVPDDEYRRIDWSATARAGRPIVRTFRAEQNQRVVCLLDNGRVMAGRVANVPRVEHAMDAVLTLARVSTGLGDKCGLVIFDREVRSVVGPAAGRGQLGRITRAMYALQPVLVESDYRNAFATTVSRFRRRAMLVVLTDLVVQAVDESLMPALPLIARTHLVLVGAVRDPEVEGWARAEVNDAEGAHRQAAAIASLAERDQAIARLQSMGATVIDAPPDELATQLADAYLRFKARGRL